MLLVHKTKIYSVKKISRKDFLIKFSSVFGGAYTSMLALGMIKSAPSYQFKLDKNSEKQIPRSKLWKNQNGKFWCGTFRCRNSQNFGGENDL